MLRSIHIWIYGIVAELEYILYPWKTSTPPAWAIKKWNLNDETNTDGEIEESVLNYDWLKSHDDKINRLQNEMIYVINVINKNNLSKK
tara:strand:- start:5244 stop:5507 length:264 start_codon:yes stop_codon:yes gene_type:complete